MSVYKNAFDDITNFIEKGKIIEEFKIEQIQISDHQQSLAPFRGLGHTSSSAGGRWFSHDMLKSVLHKKFVNLCGGHHGKYNWEKW